MLSAWLPWLAAFAVLVILPVALLLFADDHPRSDEPPDTDGDDRLPALAAA